jgi:hypothetical protein
VCRHWIIYGHNRLFYGNPIPWYDKLCKEKRNQFNMARLSYNRMKSGANKNTMNIKAKEYRKTLNTSYHKYKEEYASEHFSNLLLHLKPPCLYLCHSTFRYT